MPAVRLATGRMPPMPPLPVAARFTWLILAAARVPLEMLEALVVSVVAEGEKATLLVLVQTMAPVPVLVRQSPDIVKPPKAPALLNWIWPAEPPGTPVRTEVETCPGMPPAMVPQMVLGAKTPLHWASAATGARSRAKARRKRFIARVSIHQFQGLA